MKHTASALSIAAFTLVLVVEARAVAPLWSDSGPAGGLGKAGLVAAFSQDRAGQGMAAVDLARHALEYCCTRHEPLPLPPPDRLPPLLQRRGAVFVSAMVSGAPRCCMGTLIPREPTLAREIIANACAAALHDRRFPPITAAELGKLRVIVSVVGECRPIRDPGDGGAAIDPLRDGLAVRGPRGTGVVLPGETDDVKTMVAWGRMRAGMKRHERACYFRLEAIRFVEAPRPVTKGAAKP